MRYSAVDAYLGIYLMRTGRAENANFDRNFVVSLDS